MVKKGVREMSKALPALAGVSMLGLVGMANAAAPVTLTDVEMDGVTAGQLVISPYQVAPTLGEVLNTEIAVFRYYIEGLSGGQISTPLPTTGTPPPVTPSRTPPPGFFILGGQQ